MSANKLRAKLSKTAKDFGQEWWAAEECQHEKDLDTHQVESQMVDAILEAVKSSLPEEMSEDENTRVEMKDKYPNGMIIRYCDSRSYNQAIREVKKLLEGGEW